MKKQILATVLCVIMILTMIPVFATATTAPTTCNVLFEEDFEDGVSSLSVTKSDGTTLDSSAVSTVPVTDADGGTSYGSAYGQGEKALFVKNSDSVSLGWLGIPDNKLKALYGGTNGGYTVDVSFDWNPTTTSKENAFRISCSRNRNGGSKSNTVYLNMVENGSSAQTLTVKNRKGEVQESTIDLMNKIGNHVTDPDHIYRVRVTLTAADTTGKGATISVYLDDIKMVEDFENAASANDSYLYGFYFQISNFAPKGVIDNIKVVEYDETGASSYLNDDALIAAIRRCEYELTGLAEDKKTALASAIQTAKTAFEDANRTQESVDAATAALEVAEDDAHKVYQYQTLHTEQFEGSEPTPFYAYTNDANNESQVATVGSADDTYYGLDDNWYQLDVTADEKAGLVHEFATPSSGIGQKGDNLANNIANHYKTEVSFDYKMPEDFTTYILINAISAEHDYTFLKSGKIFQMNMDPTTGVATLFDRNSEIGTINLADYATGASFAEEVNRFRIVFAPNTIEEIDGVKYAGTMTLYINGVQAFEGKYKDNDRESAIGGMTVKCGTGDAGKPLGYIDNIELIDYDDTTLAVANSIPYVNRDKQVAAIRGGWSAFVSGSSSTAVTIKAVKAIAAGKVIAACYDENGMVEATLTDVSNLVADGTQEIPIPSGWSGDVKVFFWDLGVNALMPCAELTL